jgi:Transmembrane secretion effector
MLCARMAVTGMVHAPGDTARGVLLPVLAERAQVPLTRAASRYDGASRCAGMIGSAVGGILIAILGADHVLIVDAATFAISAVLIGSGLRGLPEARPPPRATLSEPHAYRRALGDGFRYVLASPLLLGICVVTMLAQGLDQGWNAVLLPVHVRDSLGGAPALGLVEALSSPPARWPGR